MQDDEAQADLVHDQILRPVNGVHLGPSQEATGTQQHGARKVYYGRREGEEGAQAVDLCRREQTVHCEAFVILYRSNTFRS